MNGGRAPSGGRRRGRRDGTNRLRWHGPAACLAAALCLDAYAASGIYRCDMPGTIVFSDVPCSESAELHTPSQGLSVVESAPGLETVSEANRAFVDRRRQRLAAQREQDDPIRRQAHTSAPSTEHRSRVLFAPGPVRYQQLAAARAERPRSGADERSSRSRQTLLSRSGGTRPALRRIRRDYQ